MRMLFVGLTLMLLCATASATGRGDNLIVNPGFETGAPGEVGWSTLWTRDPGVGGASLDRKGPHGGSVSLRVEHTGSRDWSLTQEAPVGTAPGEVFELSGWVRCEDVGGRVTISVIPYDSEGKVVTWFWGTLSSTGTHDWERMQRRFVTPRGCRSIRARVTGSGAGTAWFDDLELRRIGNLRSLRRDFDDTTTQDLETDTLRLMVVPATGAFSITDKRLGRTYPLVDRLTGFVGLELDEGESSLTVRGWRSETGGKATLRWELGPGSAEVLLEIAGEGAFGPDWAYPPAFATAPGQWLVVPVNEGILYPVEDATVRPLRLVGYSGHGLSMAWFGVTEGGSVDADGRPGPGLMAIIETPDDMYVRIDRLGGELLLEQPVWQAERGEWGYVRRLRFVLFDDGGYVAQAKRYRQYARALGRLVTLKEKAEVNPNVDRLIGAVNVWTWQNNKVQLMTELHRLGFRHVLFSNARSSEEIDRANELGYLSSRYDIYQDVYPPGKPPWANHEGWPGDLVLDAEGRPVRGWEIRSKQGNFPGGVICSIRGLAQAERRIPEELRDKKYLCRFIDTTTASAFKECYDPAHPTTRSQDREHKMKLLAFVSRQMNLVTGSETGIDCAVPEVHYFEGMLSLGPYRLPDAGRNMMAVAQPTEKILNYQVGYKYRVPLWELVYHDCVVSHWYWGDYNNKIPAVWKHRDLWNVLYGTPPMFMFNESIWRENRERFRRSYQTVSPVARRVGYQEMVSHEFLTADHAVQRSRFADGTTVTVNFGDQAYRGPGGEGLDPECCRVETPGEGDGE